MTIVKKKKNSKIVVDLTGPQGNAFYLLGLAKKLCKDNDGVWDIVSKQMQSGDYEHLVATFDKYFGTIVTLER